MPNNGQQPLFYEDIYEAIEKAIGVSGKTKKELAMILYPGRQIDTAKSLLSRALSPENTDVHLSIEMLITLLKETRPEDIIYYLCDEFGFERPHKKDTASFEREIKNKVRGLKEQLNGIARGLEQMERVR